MLRLERRITKDGMISVDGNLYSVPNTTRRRPVEEQLFGDPVIATALLDRLLHHAVVVQIEGSSCRMRQHADLLPQAPATRHHAGQLPAAPPDRASASPAAPAQRYVTEAVAATEPQRSGENYSAQSGEITVLPQMGWTAFRRH